MLTLGISKSILRLSLIFLIKFCIFMVEFSKKSYSDIKLLLKKKYINFKKSIKNKYYILRRIIMYIFSILVNF